MLLVLLVVVVAVCGLHAPLLCIILVGCLVGWASNWLSFKTAEVCHAVDGCRKQQQVDEGCDDDGGDDNYDDDARKAGRWYTEGNSARCTHLIECVPGVYMTA